MRDRADRYPGDHRKGADELLRRGGVAKRKPADGGADQGLQVDEGSGDVRGDPGLPEREEPERQQRPDQRQRGERHHRPGTSRGSGSAAGDDRDWQRDERPGGELHRRDGCRSPVLKQPRLDRDEGSR